MSIRPSARIKFVAVVLVVIFAPPLAYSAWVFSTEASSPGIRVALAQTGDAEKLKIALVARAAEVSQPILDQHPDLLVWPETALERDAAKDNSLKLWKSLYAWTAGNDVAVLTGIADVEKYASPSPLLARWGQKEEYYNAAALITPQLAYYALKQPAERALEVKAYRKRKPFPFAERVPFLEMFPALYPLAMHEPGKPPRNYGQGDAPLAFAFLDRAGIKHRVGAFICFEALFPNVVADLVRQGSDLLVSVSNDSQLHAGARWVTAAHAQLRAIETRRGIARSGTVGYSLFVDPFGRVDYVMPLDTPGASIRPMKLSSRQSLYVRWGDWFPVACLFMTGLFLAWSTFRIFFGKSGGH